MWRKGDHVAVVVYAEGQEVPEDAARHVAIPEGAHDEISSGDLFEFKLNRSSLPCAACREPVGQNGKIAIAPDPDETGVEVQILVRHLDCE